MANTRQDHKALLAACGIIAKPVLINIPNKIAKRCRRKFKKKHSSDMWDMLRTFHPKLFVNALNKMKGGK